MPIGIPLLLMKRSGKYLPTIESILAKNGIPDDFKYLAMIESGLMNVSSPAGARGFWQFMQSTGKERGLEINKEVDERYHYVKAKQAACDYLKKAYARFGNWTSVASTIIWVYRDWEGEKLNKKCLIITAFC